MTKLEAAANAIMLRLEAGELAPKEALRQLVLVGAEPDHAAEMIYIAGGGDDVIEL